MMSWFWNFFRQGESVKRYGGNRRPTTVSLLDKADRLQADSVKLASSELQALYSWTKDEDTGKWRADLDPAKATTAIKKHQEQSLYLNGANLPPYNAPPISNI